MGIYSKTDMLKLAVLFVCCYQVWSHPDQHRLYNDLMSSYNPLFIPMLNTSDVQRVVMDARLHKIIDVDESEGVLTTLIWLELRPSSIWTPDIFLFNDVTGHFADDLIRDNPLLVVNDMGHVRWIPPLVVKTMCDFVATEATKSCDLKLGSWVYSMEQLDLINTMDVMNLEGYVGNSIWNLESTQVQRRETKYG